MKEGDITIRSGKLNVDPFTFHQAVASRRVITAAAMAGFTIIEVMIVLAIAAVIMLIVFLAVPSLQRNNRNTQYKSEAGRILAAANEFVTSNYAVPTCASF